MMTLSRGFLGALALGGILLSVGSASAQIPYHTPGDIYSQDFQSLTGGFGTYPWQDGETLPGWHALYIRDSVIPDSYQTKSGNSSTAGLAAYAPNGSQMANRALGIVPGVAFGNVVLAVRLQNQTGKTLNRITIGYTGQLWRVIGDGPKELLVSYHVDTPESLEQGLWVAIPELSFEAPVQDATNTGFDGTLPENSEVLSTTVSDVSWPPGADLYIRFFQVNNIHNKAFAIDDFSFSAEP